MQSLLKWVAPSGTYLISNFKLTSNYSATSGAKQKNQTKTIITLNDGGSTFIGGLKQNVNKETVRKVPILSAIPIIGPLFKYKRKKYSFYKPLFHNFKGFL